MGEMPGTHGCLDSATFLFWVLTPPWALDGEGEEQLPLLSDYPSPLSTPFPSRGVPRLEGTRTPGVFVFT